MNAIRDILRQAVRERAGERVGTEQGRQERLLRELQLRQKLREEQRANEIVADEILDGRFLPPDVMRRRAVLETRVREIGQDILEMWGKARNKTRLTEAFRLLKKVVDDENTGEELRQKLRNFVGSLPEPQDRSYNTITNPLQNALGKRLKGNFEGVKEAMRPAEVLEEARPGRRRRVVAVPAPAPIPLAPVPAEAPAPIPLEPAEAEAEAEDAEPVSATPRTPRGRPEESLDALPLEELEISQREAIERIKTLQKELDAITGNTASDKKARKEIRQQLFVIWQFLETSTSPAISRMVEAIRTKKENEDGTPAIRRRDRAMRRVNITAEGIHTGKIIQYLQKKYGIEG